MKKTRLLIFVIVCSVSPPLHAASEGDWEPMFNGIDLDGWDLMLVKHYNDDHKPENYFVVDDGVIHVYGGKHHATAQPYAAMVSQQVYSHFHMYLEYRWGEAKFEPRLDLLRDAGLLYHVHGMGKPAWPLSMESQIQQTESGDAYAIGTKMSAWVDPCSLTINPPQSVTHYTFDETVQNQRYFSLGTPNKILRFRHNQDEEVDGWNSMEIIVEGDRAIHKVNGTVVMEVSDFKKWDDNKKHWVPLIEGKIALQAEGAEVFYRNIKIKPLEHQ